MEDNMELNFDTAPTVPIYGFGRSRVAKCSAHMAVLREAEDMLATRQCFSMDEVIRAAGVGGVAKALKWPSIVALIEDKHQCGLVPVTRAYFQRAERYQYLTDDNGSRVRHDRAVLNPEKFLAGGPNKPTFGFVLASGDDPGRRAIVVESFRRLVAQKGGTDKAVVARQGLLERVGALAIASEHSETPGSDVLSH